MWGGLAYWRGRGAGGILAHVLALAQTLLVGLILYGFYRESLRSAWAAAATEH
jgi:hypothetical protein